MATNAKTQSDEGDTRLGEKNMEKKVLNFKECS